MTADRVYDVAVVGAGFGGLAAALRLAEQGADVVLLEALRYPGGCASTFERGGVRYESGATLFSGLGPGGLFTTWIDRYGLDVEVELIDPLIELRGPFSPLVVGQDKTAFVAALTARAPDQAAAIRRFFDVQGRAADVLWGLFDDPTLLPPFGPGALMRHVVKSPRYSLLAPYLGKPLGRVLDSWGLTDQLFRTWANATCQITLQCAADIAEAPFAFASLDYPFRGTGHVHGGIGQLATGLVHAIEQAGGEVRLSRRVRRMERSDGVHHLQVSKDGTVRAKNVVANLLPQAVGPMLSRPVPALAKRAARVEHGWGAVMLYRVARAPQDARDHPHHLELIDDVGAPLETGNHVFLSISGADEDRGIDPAHRTITASTHIDATTLRNASPEDQARLVEAVQNRMRATITKRAPAWAAQTVSELSASPRTFERFVGRPHGLVGGVPRAASLAHYRGIFPRAVDEGLYLVGDSAFPGQSTLAVALGGVKTAELVAAQT